MVFSLRSGIEERQIVSLSPLYSSSLIRTAFPSFVLMLTKKRRKAPAFRYGDIRRIQISE